DDLPERGRDGAGDRPAADHGRQLALLGARGGARVPAGEGDRELDQPEGGGGGVSRPGARGAAARSRRARDGVRRTGPGRHREAMHSAFLYQAIGAGLDMGIVNAGQLAVYEDIEPELLERVEDVLFDRRPDATERLVEYAGTVSGEATKRELDLSWREAPVE